MQARLSDAATTGTKVISHYRFDCVNVTLVVPFGVQTGLSLGFESRGSLTEETYDAVGGPAVQPVDAVREDVRGPPGDRRPLAQRRRPARGGRRLIGRAAADRPRCGILRGRTRSTTGGDGVARDDERLERAQEEPIVGGLPDVPGILTALRLTPELGVHLRGLADELLVNDFAGATIKRAEREMIATAVSAANDCFYCMDSHGAFATALLELDGDDRAACRSST